MSEKVDLVVYSYLRNSLLSPAGLDQVGKQRCCHWFPFLSQLKRSCGQPRWLKSFGSRKGQCGLIISGGFVVSDDARREEVVNDIVELGFLIISHLGW